MKCFRFITKRNPWDSVGFKRRSDLSAYILLLVLACVKSGLAAPQTAAKPSTEFGNSVTLPGRIAPKENVDRRTVELMLADARAWAERGWYEPADALVDRARRVDIEWKALEVTPDEVRCGIDELRHGRPWPKKILSPQSSVTQPKIALSSAKDLESIEKETADRFNVAQTYFLDAPPISTRLEIRNHTNSNLSNTSDASRLVQEPQRLPSRILIQDEDNFGTDLGRNNVPRIIIHADLPEPIAAIPPSPRNSNEVLIALLSFIAGILLCTVISVSLLMLNVRGFRIQKRNVESLQTPCCQPASQPTQSLDSDLEVFNAARSNDLPDISRCLPQKKEGLVDSIFQKNVTLHRQRRRD